MQKLPNVDLFSSTGNSESELVLQDHQTFKFEIFLSQTNLQWLHYYFSGGKFIIVDCRNFSNEKPFNFRGGTEASFCFVHDFEITRIIFAT